MVKGKRHKTILEILNQSQIMGIKDIILSFQSIAGSVSESSIRRDLHDLESAGMIVIQNSCIYPASKSKSNFPVANFDPYYPEKWEIGKKAAELIHEGETIILDSGTTVRELVRALDPKLHIACITNSLMIAQELAEKPYIETIVLGGSLNIRDHAIYGNTALSMLSQVHAQKTFLGTAGISQKMGVTNLNLSLMSIRKQMVAIAEQVVVLADTSKFEKIGLSSIVPLSAIDLLITSSNLANQYRQELKSQEVKCIFA
jgi:DeoR/GlpR family transcriptional regulator of sugar metabolism